MSLPQSITELQNSIYDSQEYLALQRAYAVELIQAERDFQNRQAESRKQLVEELKYLRLEWDWRRRTGVRDTVIMPRLTLWQIIKAAFNG